MMMGGGAEQERSRRELGGGGGGGGGSKKEGLGFFSKGPGEVGRERERESARGVFLKRRRRLEVEVADFCYNGRALHLLLPGAVLAY